ncbi:hypothetical protein E2C01_062674 [Portunus trituberculatus]|uniref:Uncharacterized protein n=1 Tax=Portunus trituberculatus TaxID=210409 RepID=A0A5B7HBR7_PORTR|nr:hypothetical protein [Portunus trituberculatus]
MTPSLCPSLPSSQST